MNTNKRQLISINKEFDKNMALKEAILARNLTQKQWLGIMGKFCVKNA